MGPLLRRFAPKSACSEIAKNREQTPRFFFKNPNFRESGFPQKNGKNRASAAAPFFGANRLACRPFCPPKTGLRPDLARCRRNGAYTKAIRPEIGLLGNRKKSRTNAQVFFFKIRIFANPDFPKKMERTARRPRPRFLAPIALPVALFVHPKPDFGRTLPDVAEMGPILRRFAPKSACSEIAKNREQTPRFFFLKSEFSRIRIFPKKWKEPRVGRGPVFWRQSPCLSPFLSTQNRTSAGPCQMSPKW